MPKNVNDELRDEFSRDITNMRKQSGKTQQQIADFIGVDRITWIHYEKGTSDISMRKAILAAAFCRFDIISKVSLHLPKVSLKSKG